MSLGDVVLLIMAVILPPLPVAIKRGLCSGAFFLNLLLSVLAYLPGVVHAWYIVLKHPEMVGCSHHRADLERNPVTGTFPGHVYQAVPSSPAPQNGNMAGVYGAPKGAAHAQASYGATEGASNPPAYSLTPDSTANKQALAPSKP